ncbi:MULTISPECIES: HlyC/CorC family transporter [Inquilinus]|uniref:Mg2+/Co2+ transporter CorB n=1 Tax=Inquilinus ginsengisoli TaxID=363840 RepID=A0ABU1JZD2_9PROT|nr:HlyC/CorC family transporter [Inquilinus ginsengisoli]MDR6293986.1 Mg2+/Co2+ transporter CorB [Inquilinus ginsengisoli]
MSDDLALLLSVAGIVILLVISAFFAGSETALTAASRARMHQLESHGLKRAGIVNRLREQKDRLIGALLLGNTLVNILASAVATSLLSTMVGASAVPIATVVMTALILIFAEVLPKTYAITHADRAALSIAPLVRSVVWVLGPIVRLVNWLVRGVLRLFGADPHRVGLADYVDELRGAIELHRGSEAEVAQERQMLRSILDLGDVYVSEIMTHRRTVEAIDAELPLQEVVGAMLNSPYTRMPLCQGGLENIIGVLHAKDVLRALQAAGGDPDRLDIRRIATKPWFIPDTTSLLDQLHAFRVRREHFAIVVDEYGDLKGVVTLEDILEEIVGDIVDEHDLPVAGVRPQPNGSYLVDGTVTIRDLNRRFEWRLPDSEASTVAGLVLHEAQRLPEVGQAFTFHGFRFEILRRQRNQITAVRLTPPVDDPEEG